MVYSTDLSPPRALLDDLLRTPGPSLSLVTGGRGTGKTALVREATGGLPASVRVLRQAAAPLPDPDQRLLFAGALERVLEDPAPRAEGDSPPAWPTLLEALAGDVERTRRPTVIVLDDVHRLLEVRGGGGDFLAELWGRLRARALPVHLVLAGATPHLDRELDRSAPGLRAAAALELALGPLPLREVARRLETWPPHDRLRAWAVFGGVPDRIRRLDATVGLARNVERLLLAPDAPLLRAGLDALEGEVQSLPRYVSLLRALANGARDWGGLRRGCPDFETGSQMAPYMGRLEAMGLVEVRRSLDAGERSRNRRYEIADPFLAFWYRFLLPALGDVSLAARPDLWAGTVQPRLDDHVALLFPRACREWLLRAGEEALPARGRIAGSLWGTGYDLPVAGTLRNGAVVYGACRWSGDPVDADLFDHVHRQLRETRYGFGREGRHRVAFSATGFTSAALRAAGRDPLVHGVGLEALVGD